MLLVGGCRGRVEGGRRMKRSELKYYKDSVWLVRVLWFALLLNVIMLVWCTYRGQWIAMLNWAVAGFVAYVLWDHINCHRPTMENSYRILAEMKESLRRAKG